VVANKRNAVFDANLAGQDIGYSTRHNVGIGVCGKEGN
jgi:hypothetical protein